MAPPLNGIIVSGDVSLLAFSSIKESHYRKAEPKTVTCSVKRSTWSAENGGKLRPFTVEAKPPVGYNSSTWVRVRRKLLWSERKKASWALKMVLAALAYNLYRNYRRRIYSEYVAWAKSWSDWFKKISPMKLANVKRSTNARKR